MPAVKVNVVVTELVSDPFSIILLPGVPVFRIPLQPRVAAGELHQPLGHLSLDGGELSYHSYDAFEPCIYPDSTTEAAPASISLKLHEREPQSSPAEHRPQGSAEKYLLRNLDAELQGERRGAGQNLESPTFLLRT